MQFLQSRQLMPQSKDSRSLRQILRDSSSGKSADQQEVNAAVSRGTIFFIPALVTLFAVSLPAALPLYWLTSSSVAFWQQSIILKDDAEEADKSVNSTVTKTNV
jgi:membrane protein insertase Oxa1/YidC/SpoIIIJ